MGAGGAGGEARIVGAMTMRDEFTWIGFRQGVSCDFRRAAHRLGTAMPGLLKWLYSIRRGKLAHLRDMSWHTFPRELRAVLLLTSAGLLLLSIVKLPQWQAARWEGRIELKEVAKQETNTQTTVVQTIGGAVLRIGFYFTAKTLKTTQEGQITDRFSKAINQLGETGLEKLAIRLGDIYALERIARDSERDHWPIMEILTAYVREHPPWKECKEEVSPQEAQLSQNHQSPPRLTTDIQAILTVLGRRTRTYRHGEDLPLNLNGTYLWGVDLKHAHIEGAHLMGAYLGKAILYRAHLEEALLVNAHREGAHLEEAHLERAALIYAHLEGADLSGADLRGACFSGANLDGVNLQAACLQGATVLSVEQLCTVKSLYMAQLDPLLLEQIQQQYPHLLDRPKPPG
jgi:hypothetical protein